LRNKKKLGTAACLTCPQARLRDRRSAFLTNFENLSENQLVGKPVARKMLKDDDEEEKYISNDLPGS
jgi:hypothetical protein